MLPQLIWIAFAFFGIGVHVVKHGEKTEYDGWANFIAVFLAALILWWGGFFDCFLS